MLSFLIVNYHTSAYVLKLVQSIKQFIINIDYEILIFDNSEDEKEYKNLFSIKSENTGIYKKENNIGFVAANNYLYKKAVGDIIILINPDTMLIDESLTDLIKYVVSDNTIALAGPQLLNVDYSYQVSFFQFPRFKSLIQEHIFLYRKNPYEYDSNISKSRYCDVVKGACLVVNKKVWKEDKIFDDIFVMYSEEVDLCKRVQLKGLKTYYFAEAKIIHYGEKSSSLNFASEYSLYNYYRSRLLFFHKYNSKIYYNSVKIILVIFLIEKSILLFLLTRFKNSKLHLKVLMKIINETKYINSL